MNSKNSLWQFFKDGLVGVAVILILFGILLAAIKSLLSEILVIPDWSVLIAIMFLFPEESFISPMPFVMLIGFISTGVGGRFLETITSRRSWIKPILIISIVSWLIGIVLFPILLNDWEWEIVGFMAASAGAGFLIAGLAGVLFNPTQRLFRLIIGAIASTVVSYGVGFLIFGFQMAQ